MPLLFFLLFPSLPAQDAEPLQGGVRGRVWVARYRGSIAAEGPADNGTTLNAASDLGLEDFAAAPEFQAWLDVPAVARFQVGYWRIRLEGDAVLSEDAVFDGRTFPAGSATHSTLGLDVFSLDAEFPLLKEPFDLGLLAGVRYIAGDARIESGGTEERANLNRPLLLPGVHAGVAATPWLRGDARIEGIALSAHNVKLRYAELDAEVSLLPGAGISVSIGYREVFTVFKARKDSLNFDLDGSLGGPMVAVAWSF